MFLKALPLLLSTVFTFSIITSCGTSQQENEADVQAWSSKPYTQRFSQAEINAVFSTQTETKAGKTMPVSKPPLKNFYTAQTAPEALKAELGDFTAAGVIKGYLNLGYVPSSGFQSKLVSSFEAISQWALIKGADGKKLFKFAHTTNSSGSKVPDNVDGKVAEGGEKVSGLIGIDSPIGGIPASIGLEIFNKNGEVQADIVNTKNVSAPIVGTVIKTGGLKIHLKAYPYAKGWLVYGAASAKLEKLEDSISPELMLKTVDLFFNWLKDRTVVPL